MTVRDDYDTTPPGGGRLTTKFYSVDAHEHAATLNTLLGDLPAGTVVGTSDTQTLTNKTIDGASNTVVNVAGMLLPVQGATTGAETYTITSGSVSQINGTAVAGYSPSIGDRILIATAPAASGTSSTFNLSNRSGNGIYRVTGNTTNLTLVRASDMSGSLLPFGLSVYVENSNWNAGTIYTVSSVGTSFTYGTTAMQWLGTGGSNLNVSTVFISDSGSTPLGFWNGANSVYVKPTGSGNATTLTLPNTATSDTLVGRASTDTLTNKTLTSPTLTTPVLGTPASGNLTNCTFPTLNQNTSGTAAVATKWVPRVGTTTSSATPSIDASLYEQYNITALAAAITSVTVTNPAEGLKLTIRIKDNGTARAIALGSSFRALGATLPTTTVVSKTLYLGCIYNGADTVWDVVAVAQEA